MFFRGVETTNQGLLIWFTCLCFCLLVRLFVSKLLTTGMAKGLEINLHNRHGLYIYRSTG